jgi:hypothetical protein
MFLFAILPPSLNHRSINALRFSVVAFPVHLFRHNFRLKTKLSAASFSISFQQVIAIALEELALLKFSLEPMGIHAPCVCVPTHPILEIFGALFCNATYVQFISFTFA